MARFPIISWILGGRPMVRGQFEFMDAVNKKPVYCFTDAYGRKWMAQSSWDPARCSYPPGSEKRRSA